MPYPKWQASDLSALSNKKHRQLKHKALVDLLRTLHARGLSYQRGAKGASTIDVMSSDVTPDVSPALGERWQQQWERSGTIYYTCVLRLTQLRLARGRAHADLTAREVPACIS